MERWTVRRLYSAIMWHVLRTAGLGLTLLVPCAVLSQEPRTTQSGDTPSQEATPPTGTPTFYAHSRQVIVEAEVWDKSIKKEEHPWIGNEPLTPSEEGQLKRRVPPVTRGLMAKDFHIFDNGIEQTINYFKEADFPAVDATNKWTFVPTTDGTWGTFDPFSGSFGLPSASYLIGYVPPPIHPGECHTIRVAVEGRELHVNRDHYCARKDVGGNDIDAIAGKKLGAKMRAFANSSARGTLRVSMQAFAFWSSRVLHLATETSATGVEAHPSADYTYVLDVHDSKAPAAVQISVGFKFPALAWYFPCQTDSSVYILGIAYKANRDVAGQFADTYSCLTPVRFWNNSGAFIPTWFGSQINLTPGDFDVRVVVTDGHDFGRAEVPLRVQPLDTQRLTMSDIAVGAVLRGAAWALRDAASVAPAPVIPTPLVSRDTQFLPDADVPPRLGKHSPLFLYFEVYEPLLENRATAIYYRARIADLKTGAWVMNTGPMSAAEWMLPGNTVIPIGLKLATENLTKGAYKVEIQAFDSAGRQTEWRQTNFTIQ